MATRPDDRHDRRLIGFSRLLAATLDADEASRESIAALARRIDRGDLGPHDRRDALDALDDILMGEVARRHR